MRLEGKVALISGAARGMGEEEARLFAREGAKVVLGDVLDEAGKAVATAIRASGGGAIYRSLDVTDQADWAAAVEAAESAWGRLDILVNNAGVTSYSKGDKDSLEDFDRCHEINSRGSYLGIRASIPAMRRAGGGSIVNISSISGLVGQRHVHAGSNIRVNSVHPGPIQTDMTRDSWTDPESKQRTELVVPLGRYGQPVDVANAVLFLASDEAAYITGAEIVVDGGYTAQ